MTQYDRAVLHIGSGEFHMVGDLMITEGTRTGYLTEGSGSTAWSFIQGLTGGGDSSRKGAYIEGGGGIHMVEIEFTGWQGSTDADGNQLQWGDTGNGGTKTDATGEKALAQIQCLTHYMNTHNVGSLADDLPTIEFGERSSDSDSKYDPMEVALEGPNMTKQGDNGEWFDGQLTCLAAIDLRSALDSVVDVPW